jgi:hypothetical protein
MLELKKQKVYKKVYDMAREALLASDAQRQLGNAGIAFEGRGDALVAEIPWFNERMTFELPGFVFRNSRGANITLVTKILLLHYINTATGIPLRGGHDRVPYEDIPGCRHYQPVFERRVIKPLQTAFGHDNHAFLEAGVSLGGVEEEYGDASFTLSALPMVPMTYILWVGDEEFPPSVKLLFDPSVPGYLPLEDIVVIAKLASVRILKEARVLFAEDYDG